MRKAGGRASCPPNRKQIFKSLRKGADWGGVPHYHRVLCAVALEFSWPPKTNLAPEWLAVSKSSRSTNKRVARKTTVLQQHHKNTVWGIFFGLQAKALRTNAFGLRHLTSEQSSGGSGRQFWDFKDCLANHRRTIWNQGGECFVWLVRDWKRHGELIASIRC